MTRFGLLLLILALSGCGGAGGNSLAAFGPNVIPPPGLQTRAGDPYYPAAASTATPAGAAAAPVPLVSLPPDGAKAETARIPTTTPSGPIASGEQPIRIVEREGALPNSTRPPAETSRIPSTSTQQGVPGLLRSSTTPQLRPVPTASAGHVLPASYSEPVRSPSEPQSVSSGEWRRR